MIEDIEKEKEIKMKKTKCPSCGAVVEAKYYDGAFWGYYEEKPLSALEKKVRALTPFRSIREHKCDES